MTDGESPQLPPNQPRGRSAFRLRRRASSGSNGGGADESGGDRLRRRPPSQRSPILSVVSGVLSFVVLSAFISTVAIGWAVHKLREPGPLLADKVVVIPPRTRAPDVVAELERQGVIKDEALVNIALVVERKRSRVQAGEYLFHKGDSMQAVIDKIVSGRQLLHSLTIPEGLTSEQIVQRLMADDALDGTVEQTPPEGSLFPETYKFVRGTKRSVIIHQMQLEAKQALQKAWNGRAADNPLKTPIQLLTLASMIEKETGIPSERPLVAGVFLNRLKKGMRLQSDPTVVYSLVGGKGTLGRSISRTELDTPSPYNTYVIKGLPPGPIANPGRASLEAAAHPAKTDDLYFVADGSGGHVFASTLAQHDKNVERWRELEKAKAADQTHIDHVAPTNAPLPSASGARAVKSRTRLPRSDQHGELSQPAIYGALPGTLAAGRVDRGQQGGTAAQVASFSPDLQSFGQMFSDADAGGSVQKGAPATTIAIGPTVESLGLSLSEHPVGPKSPLLDGPADNPTTDPENVTTASPEGQAQAQPTAASGPGATPPVVAAATTSPVSKATAQPDSLAPINGHPRIIDASAGTPLDPLKNTTWDLNSPKVVPPLN